MLKKLLFATVFLGFCGAAHATHMSGGEIYWECIGPNQYRIRLVVYRDCAGINVNPSYNLELSSPCGEQTLTVTTPGGVEISQLCDLELPNSTCNNGNLPGIEQYIYSGTVTLPPCDSWSIRWTNIYRNDAIVNLTNPGDREMFIESIMNTAEAPCNDSPVFTNTAIPYVCLGYPVSYSYGVVDAEADSMSYALIDARMLGGADIPYVAGYSGAEPIPGLTLDPVTGLINFTLSLAGNWVVVVQVTQYDEDGNVTGIIMRDMQFVAYPCSNIPPDAATGLVTNTSGAAWQTGPRAVTVCESGDFCFDMVISDPNASNILDAFSNIAQNLPGATFSFTGTNPITATVCWTAQAGTQGFYPFIVNVNDGACPIPAFQTYVYSVTVLPGLHATLNVTDEGCQGSGNGSITTTVTAGTAPFTYAWDHGADTPDITAGAGTYTVVISDDNGCVSAPLSGTIGSAGLPNIADAGPDLVGCAGAFPVALNGSVQNATGGSWTGGSGSFAGNWPAITYMPGTADLSNGGVDLILTTTGNTACPPDADTVHIALPNSFIGASVTGTDLLCHNDNEGQAVFAPEADGLSYAWNDPAGQTTAVATDLAAGDYTVTVTDAFGCDTTMTVTIDQPDELVVGDIAVTDEPCAGGNDGTAIAVANGGTAPHVFTWSTGHIGATLTAGAGTYTVTVTDANGCAGTGGEATITALGQPNAADAGADLVACMGDYPITVTGVVTNATGGTWSGGQGTLAGSGLSANYTPTTAEVIAGSVQLVLTTTGNTTCPADADTVTITLSNSFLDAHLVTTPVPCNGTANGTITAVPANGAFTYAWNDPAAQSSPTATGLMAGSYAVTITDDLGCDTTMMATVTEPTTLAIASTASTDATCAGQANGTATITIAGGTPSYAVGWSNGMTGANLTGLVQGTYIATVTDANGCTVQATAVVAQPDPITLVAQAPDTVCVNAVVELSALASGGNGGYLYNWGGLGFSGTIQAAFATSQIVTVTVTDQLGCTGPVVQLPITVLDLAQADLITYGDTAVCPGGSATVGASLSGYPGTYTIEWPGLGTNGPGPFIVPITQDQTIAVVVTDACNNTLNGAIVLDLETPPTFTLPPVIAEGCAPLTVQMPDLALGNVSFLWQLGNGSTSVQASPQVTYPAGTFSVSLTVSTPLGCTSSSASAGQVIAHAPPTADFGATPWTTDIDNALVQFNEACSNGITSFSWTFGDGGTSGAADPAHTFTEVGTFDVELFVTDGNGCTASATHPVIITPVYDITIPTAFTPNTNGGGGGTWVTGDLSNDVFYPFVRFVEDFRMRVFNRWGELIFESTDLSIGWDGYYRGQISPQDVYVVQTWFRFVDGKEIQKLTDLTLLR